jgi:hypothetical protein
VKGKIRVKVKVKVKIVDRLAREKILMKKAKMIVSQEGTRLVKRKA